MVSLRGCRCTRVCPLLYTCVPVHVTFLQHRVESATHRSHHTLAAETWVLEDRGFVAWGPADAGLRACTCRERKGERRDAQDRSLGTAFHLCIQTWWGDSEEPQLWTCALGCPGTAHLLPQGVQHGSLTLHTSRWQPGWAGCGPSEGTASVAVEPGS